MRAIISFFRGMTDYAAGEDNGPSDDGSVAYGWGVLFGILLLSPIDPFEDEVF